jgi:hypothetical protein
MHRWGTVNFVVLALGAAAGVVLLAAGHMAGGAAALLPLPAHVWWQIRERGQAETPVRAPVSVIPPTRLAVAAVAGSMVALALSSVTFTVRCRTAPGSQLANYCDGLRERPALLLLVLCGAPLLGLAISLVGVRRRDWVAVLAGVVFGLAMTVAAHMPEWVASASA